MKNIKINSRINFRLDFFETNLKESIFYYFNKKVPLASDKKSNDVSKKPIQRFTILFAKDARLKSKIVEFLNVKSFFTFSKLIITFESYLFYANITLITVCLRWLPSVAIFLDNCMLNDYLTTVHIKSYR